MAGMWHGVSVVMLVMTTALAGCAFDDASHVAIAGQGQRSGKETKTLDCDETGHIAVGGQGQGTMTITVQDADGHEIYRKAFRGSEQSGESKDLSGEPGQWTLQVDFGGTLGVGAWNGQYGITLTC